MNEVSIIYSFNEMEQIQVRVCCLSVCFLFLLFWGNREAAAASLLGVAKTCGSGCAVPMAGVQPVYRGTILFFTVASVLGFNICAQQGVFK